MNKVLDELRSGVDQLFRSIQCDSSVIQDMLGSDDRVSNKNILQYMGIIEQKTMELLQAQQYLQMKVCSIPCRYSYLNISLYVITDTSYI